MKTPDFELALTYHTVIQVIIIDYPQQLIRGTFIWMKLKKTWEVKIELLKPRENDLHWWANRPNNLVIINQSHARMMHTNQVDQAWEEMQTTSAIQGPQ